jgi:transposase
MKPSVVMLKLPSERRECRPIQQWWRGDKPFTPLFSMVAALAIRSLVAASARRRDPVQEFVQDLYDGCLGARTFNPQRSPMKKKKKYGSTKARAAAHGGLNLAAGIDIGAQELVAAVPLDRNGPTVRSFSSFTSGIEALRDWLLECRIKTVAIESTGNYWITCYTMLEEAGIDVCLVNARHVKGVPGKKTDVCDAQWLQQLHSAGLLKKSFRPHKDIAAMRYLTRHRAGIVAEASKQIQLMQKVMTEMNLHIQHVFSDVDGLSAQAIITAILAGERDAEKLAALRHKSCRSPLAKIIEALRGDYRPEYLFVLGQCQRRWQQCNEAVAECDKQIADLIKAVQGDCDAPPPSATQPPKRLNKNSPAATTPVQDEAFRFYAVDLAAIPGIGSGVLSVLMSELGTGSQIKKAFRTAHAFASWMGLCPDNRISGGKVLKAKTRKVPSRVAQALRMAAFAVAHCDNKLGELCRLRCHGNLDQKEISLRERFAPRSG